MGGNGESGGFPREALGTPSSESSELGPQGFLLLNPSSSPLSRQRPGGPVGGDLTNKLKPLLATWIGLWKIKGAGAWETATNLMKGMNSRCGLWPKHSCCPWGEPWTEGRKQKDQAAPDSGHRVSVSSMSSTRTCCHRSTAWQCACGCGCNNRSVSEEVRGGRVGLQVQPYF